MLYVFDKTQKNEKGELAVFVFETVPELIAHLEKICPKLLGKTRKQLMQDAADFGFGEDDRFGKAFYEYLTEYLNMGVIRKDGTPIRCNVFQTREYQSPDYGM